MPIRSALSSLFLGGSESGAAEAPSKAIQVHTAEPVSAAETMQQFESQLTAQADVNRRLGELVRQLDGTLGTLPELARQQVRLVDTLASEAARAKDRDAALTRGLKDLGDGAERQTQVLGLVQQQLDLHYETSRRVADILGEARTALGAFSATSERHARSIESLAEATRRRTIQSDRLERRLQLWLVVTTALSTTALVYALVVALRDAPQAQPVPAVRTVEAGTTTDPATAVAGTAAPTAGTPAAGTAAVTPEPQAVGTASGKPVSDDPASSGTAATGTAQPVVDPVAPGAVRGGWADHPEP